MSGDPTCAYVRTFYGLNVRRGTRVLALGEPGTVVGGSHHVFVRLDGEKRAEPYHPSDIAALTGATGHTDMSRIDPIHALAVLRVTAAELAFADQAAFGAALARTGAGCTHVEGE